MRFPTDNLWRWALAFALCALGCQPNIGDDCRNHSECAYSGTRICEPNFPGGYCTIFSCEPGSCPDEAVCVAFGSVPSPRPECADPTDIRLRRTFCMAKCDERSDCRDDEGYDCVDLGDKNQNPWGAVVVERGSYSNKVCTVPLSGNLAPASSGTAVAGVCAPPLDPTFPSPAPTSSSDGGADASPPAPDASFPPPDASFPPPDASFPPPDASPGAP